MRKTLVALLALSGASAFAMDNSAFQQFDNEYNLGYGITQMGLANGGNQQTLQQSQYLNLEVERLFNVGVWADVNANMMIATNSLGNQATGIGQGNSGVGGVPGMPATQDPYVGGVNAKVGYAIPLVSQHLQVIPYVTAGRNTNLAMSTIVGNGYNNITNDFFYTGGVGARLEYRINQYIDLYADQNGTYNWDQSGPSGGMQPKNNMVFTSTIGAKFNVVKNLQLGVNGFYNNYQYLAAAPNTSSANGGAISGSTIGTYSVYQPQNQFGGMVTIGLTY
jgi:hypothetical protein